MLATTSEASDSSPAWRQEECQLPPHFSPRPHVVLFLLKVHGEPFSRIAKARRDEDKAKKQAERLKDVNWDKGMPP